MARTLAALGLVALVVIMIARPEVAFYGALRGLETWWQIVMPALLPFFLVSELLLSLGALRFIAALFEPAVRPLFNLPGVAAFVIVLGYTSGAPLGAVYTARLRAANLLTRAEAERLIAFTSNASPLFMFVAIPVGMLNNPELGTTIAFSHYTANLILGFLLGLGSRRFAPQVYPRSPKAKPEFALPADSSVAWGTLLTDAIRRSVATMALIGGFITFFSVIIEFFRALGLLELVSRILAFLLWPLNLSPHLSPGIACGLLEMTMGCRAISEAPAGIREKLTAVSLVLGWTGLSIHAQVAGVLADTDVRLKTFVLGRVFQSLTSAVLVSVFMPVSVPVFKLAPGLAQPTISSSVLAALMALFILFSPALIVWAVQFGRRKPLY